MWQVFLYLANEHQVRERDARAYARGRRWPFGRRAQQGVARASGSGARRTPTADRPH